MIENLRYEYFSGNSLKEVMDQVKEFCDGFTHSNIHIQDIKHNFQVYYNHENSKVESHHIIILFIEIDHVRY